MKRNRGLHSWILAESDESLRVKPKDFALKNSNQPPTANAAMTKIMSKMINRMMSTRTMMWLTMASIKRRRFLKIERKSLETHGLKRGLESVLSVKDVHEWSGILFAIVDVTIVVDIDTTEVVLFGRSSILHCFNIGCSSGIFWLGQRLSLFRYGLVRIRRNAKGFCCYCWLWCKSSRLWLRDDDIVEWH